MKITFTFVSFFFIYGVAYSQLYFGGTRLETKNEILQHEIDVDITTDDDQNILFFSKEKETSIKILFNSDGIAYYNVLVPVNQKVLNNMITSFNKQFIVKSEKEWVHYTSGFIFDYQLVYHKNVFMFIITQKSITSTD